MPLILDKDGNPIKDVNLPPVQAMIKQDTNGKIVDVELEPKKEKKKRKFYQK